MNKRAFYSWSTDTHFDTIDIEYLIHQLEDIKNSGETHIKLKGTLMTCDSSNTIIISTENQM